jgi:hypothetical protein
VTEPPSIATLRALAAALGLQIPDADLERLIPEVDALWRHADRLRRIPFDATALLGHDRPR